MILRVVLPALVMGALWLGGPVLVLSVYDRLARKNRVKGRFAAGLLVVLVAFAISLFFFLYPADWENPLLSRLSILLVPLVIVGVLLNKALAPPPGIEGLDLDPEHPRMKATVQQAQATLPYFTGLFARNSGNALIRFSRLVGGNVKERVWAYVEGYENGLFHVSWPTPYLKETPTSEAAVPEAEIEDWMFVHPDSTVKGGFSIIAGIRRLEAQGRRLNRTIRKQKRNLIDFGRPNVPPK